MNYFKQDKKQITKFGLTNEDPGLQPLVINDQIKS